MSTTPFLPVSEKQHLATMENIFLGCLLWSLTLSVCVCVLQGGGPRSDLQSEPERAERQHHRCGQRGW